MHPTPIYETLAMGLGAWILWQLRDRFRAGVLFAIYLIYAGTERFLVEFLRRNNEVAFGLTTAQLESLAMMLAGVVWIYAVKRRHGTLGRHRGRRAPVRRAMRIEILIEQRKRGRTTSVGPVETGARAAAR